MKARIFDVVSRAGETGIDAMSLLEIIYDQRRMSPQALRSHIFQINEAIRDEGLMLRSYDRRYFFKKVKCVTS